MTARCNAPIKARHGTRPCPKPAVPGAPCCRHCGRVERYVERQAVLS